ncbi:flagellar motor switch protein FliN [Lachnospiraceae bacterium KM106-2]|nr:flagellar motor switch protein FliN [Lachnospiraceae bacterium KM106-2]
MDGMLSQEEINALLNSVGNDEESAEPETTEPAEELSAEEKDAIGEISNISMGTAATTLSTLVNQKVVITTPVVSYSSWNELSDTSDRPCVFIQISYKEGLEGNNILILKEADVKVITDLMMGGDGKNLDEGGLSDLHLSAISEAMNQMMGSASTSLSSMIEKKVDISPPTSSIVDLNESFEEQDVSDFLKGKFVKVSFKMEIGDLVDSEIMQLYPCEFGHELFDKFTHNDAEEAPAPAAAPTPAPQPQQSAPAPAPMQQQAAPQMAMPQMGMPQMGMPQMSMMQQDVNVSPAQFQQFTPGMNMANAPENIDLIMDVPLEVTVELGRTNKSIKEILDFAPGTIIELDKLAGEPIDVLVNGKFVAKGEVVVIEESFGIRVTEIIK